MRRAIATSWTSLVVTLVGYASAAPASAGGLCNLEDTYLVCDAGDAPANLEHCKAITGCTNQDGNFQYHADCAGYPVYRCALIESCDCYYDKLLEHVWWPDSENGGDSDFPPPKKYKVGDKVHWQGLEYKCRKAHTRREDRDPPSRYDLWARINTHGVWAEQVLYKKNQKTVFGQYRYQALKDHQSKPGQEPAFARSLWKRVR